MEFNKIYITEICEDILDNYFPQIDSLSELLSVDIKRASRIIVNKIKRVLQNFEEYCPLTASQIITPNSNGQYEFHNNYKECLQNNENWENLELIPLTIIKVGGSACYNIGHLAQTANYWKYNAPVLKLFSNSNSVQIDAAYHYPILIEYTEDGFLNKFSHIFGLDEKQRMMFFNICELQFLEMIRSNENRVDFPTSIKFFNLDEDIQRLKEVVDEDKQACSALGIAWK